jgi:hypothetical protein
MHVWGLVTIALVFSHEHPLRLDSHLRQSVGYEIADTASAQVA